MSTGDDDAKTQETPEEPVTAAPVAASPEDVAATGGAGGTPVDEDPWPFDDEGVFRIRRKEDVGLAPFTVDDPDEPGALRFSSHDELTLDAFEKAVSRKIHERFGAATPQDEPSDAPTGAPQGADELVASVLSALTGKDARSALSEVRDKLAAGPDAAVDEPRGADIIDLQAAREARRRPDQSEGASRIGEVLKDTVTAFMSDYACQTGCDTVSIDGAFLKTHGNALLGSLFQGLAQALLPQVAQLTGAPAAPTSKPGAGPVDVDELARWEGAAAETPPESAAEAASDRPAAEAAETENGATQHPKGTESAPESTPTPAPAKAADGTHQAPRPTTVSVKVDVGSILANLFTRRPKP
jgi:hypothetical protein